MPTILQIGLAGFITLSSSLSPNFKEIKDFPVPVIEMTDKDLATALTLKELVEAKADEAGVDKELALRIAFCESTFRQFDKNGKPLRGIHNSNDVGLFQINEDFHAKKSAALGDDIYSTEGNIDYAMRLLKAKGGQPWSSSRPCWGKTATA